MLLSDAGIVALASQPEQPRLHPSDLLLLVTFLRANDSLRQVRPAWCLMSCCVSILCGVPQYCAIAHPALGLCGRVCVCEGQIV